jgi:small subunit ribosomal protein S18
LSLNRRLKQKNKTITGIEEAPLKRGKTTTKRKKTFYQKAKICRFCADSSNGIFYRDFNTLKHFVTDRGKIIPRRISGNCAKHQRHLTRAIKQARVVSIMPFVASSV